MANKAAPASSPRHTIMDEFWGGLASMLVALPSAIAFGVLVFSAIAPQMAGEGALVGMIGAACMGLAAPLFGRTPALISAPCAPAAAVLSGLAIELISTGTEINRIPALLALTALLAALLQILYGLLKGGRLIKYIPFPVVSGYLSGVGLIIAVGQFPNLLGLPKGVGLWQGLMSPHFWQWPGIAVGLVTIIAMLTAPRLTQKVPAAIVGLFAGILSYFLLSLFMPALLSVETNSLIIGPIRANTDFPAMVKSRLQSVLEISLADLHIVAYSALALSALLSIDTLKTCVVLDALTKKRHDSNQELFGQGIANLLSFVMGGMSGSGTMGASLVNVTSGGRKTQSGLIEGSLVVLAILALAPLIAWVPIAALAGILLVVATRMFDWHAFHLLRHKETLFDFAVIAAVVVVAETVGLIAASATGIGLAIFLFIRDQIRASVLRRRATLKETSSKTHRLEEERSLIAEHGDEAAIYELQGNLFFGTTDHLFSQLEPDLAICRWLLFDMRRVECLDYTAAHLFTLMQDRLRARGGELIFSGMPSRLPSGQDLLQYMTQVGLVNNNGNGIRIFDTRDEALEWMEDKILQAAGWTEEFTEQVLDLADIELLRKSDDATLAALRPCLHERTVQAGERIFVFGDSGDELFLIRRGIVQIFLPLSGGKHHHLATFNQGDYFGEMAFLDHRQRSAEAIAKTECELYELSRHEFDIQVHNNAVLGTRIFARIARAISLRLRQTDIELCSLEDR
ncbi:SLC26A/SulP transporter family protein [Methylobacter sp.]|uniref:SLC26A/SulP transporter family protein n=1 Tax=Methylobacter sp. TaxID=2051955 RepID=UPI002FDCF06E